jgi:hypothetical protein
VSSATVKAVKGRRPIQSRAALVLVCEQKFTLYAYNVPEYNLIIYFCVYWDDLGALFFRHRQLLIK